MQATANVFYAKDDQLSKIIPWSNMFRKKKRLNLVADEKQASVSTVML